MYQPTFSSIPLASNAACRNPIRTVEPANGARSTAAPVQFGDAFAIGPYSVVQADHITEVGIPLQFPPSRVYDHAALFAGLAQLLDPSYTTELTLQKDGRWLRKPKLGPVPVQEL